jgi:hypothetical protein
MRHRVRTIALVALLVLAALPATGALGMTNGGGDSANAPGQERAEAQCTNVWSELQADLRAGGGPKSGPSTGPVGTYPEGSGPTNCDHFWQLQEAIGQG